MSSILVTCASRGIGLATALVLARAGHTVHASMHQSFGIDLRPTEEINPA